MKTSRILLVILLNFFLLRVVSQTQFNCSSQDRYLKQIESNPAFKNNQQQLEEETRAFIANLESARPASSASYIIPVVFHVIYTSSYGNISDAQIINQIGILNKEFNRLQPDTALTPAAFKSLAAAFNVEFRLATKDPDGNCTNGINRVYSSLSNCSFEEDEIKSLSYWPSNKYLNIWLVQSMHYSASLDCNGGGYATFPGGPATLDGINIRGDLIGDIGTAASNSSWGNFMGRYLIHELGHWFNLRHIWGDMTCGNDLVADTPPAENSNSGCPAFPRRPLNSCGSNADGEMYTNYMDYTNGPCLNMFSAGQVNRMTACINSPVSGRSNLWTPANLNATGTNDPYSYPVTCVANPQVFPFGTQVICKGDSIKFSDHSYGGTYTSRLWHFEGGQASGLTDSVVFVKYNTVGSYSVSLTKVLSGTSKTVGLIDKVLVIDNNPNPNYIFPFHDSFEDMFAFSEDWHVVNENNDDSGWELFYTTGYSGSNCVGINNFGKSAPLRNELISPAYDLSAIQSPTLTFRLHFANRVSANKDRLQVLISNNCGKSWQQIYSREAPNSLSTVSGNIVVPYFPFPGSDEDWRQDRVNIINSLANGIVQFKFVFISGGGGNIFIDDINIDGRNTTGLSKQNNVSKLNVFPNPAKNNLHIAVDTKERSPLTIEIRDVLGRLCLSANTATSKGNADIDISSLKNGVYFLTVKGSNGKNHTTKFIKQE